MEFLSQLEPWHWFVASIVLVIVEIVATTGFFIGIALAALLLSGLLTVMPDLSWPWQLILFGGLSVALTVAYQVYFKNFNNATDNPLLNDRAAQQIGKQFVLDQDIEEQGAQMLGDTRWTLRSQRTLVAGTKVKVVATEGMDLVIEAVV